MEQAAISQGEPQGGLGPIEALTPLARPGDWHGWLRAVSLLIASILTLAALTCFIAFNWQDMSRVARVGLVGLGMVASAGITLWAGPRSAARGPLLLLTFGLVGLLFALVGQVYQLGANSYGLFFNWALFAFPLVLVGRAQIVWFAWLVVLWIGLYFMASQAPGSVTGLWGYLLNPWVAPLLSAALVLSLRQFLVNRMAWLRPSLLPGLVALAAAVPWYFHFWLLLWPNQLVDLHLPISFWLIWLVASLALAASLLVSAFVRKEALLTFVGVLWAAGAVVAVGFRVILMGDADSLPDGWGYYLMFGLVIVGCFIGASAVMRRWLQAFAQRGEQDSGQRVSQLEALQRDASFVRSAVDFANHWAVSVLRVIGGLLGGLLITVALQSMTWFSYDLPVIAGIGLLLAALCLYFSQRMSLKDPSSHSGTHAFLFILYMNGFAFVMRWAFEVLDPLISPFDIKSYVLRAAVLAFFLAGATWKIWRPGQVVLLIACLALLVFELFRFLNFEQASLFLVALLVASHFAAPRWQAWQYLLWGLLIVTLGLLEIGMIIPAAGLGMASDASLHGLALGPSPYWQQRLLIVVGMVGLALYVFYDRQRRDLEIRPLFPYAAMLLLATIFLPLMSIFAVLLMLAGRQKGSLVLEVIGWLTLLVSLNQWYFSLSGSLLVKSGYLAISALLMWGMFAVLTWLLAPPALPSIAAALEGEQEGQA